MQKLIHLLLVSLFVNTLVYGDIIGRPIADIFPILSNTHLFSTGGTRSALGGSYILTISDHWPLWRWQQYPGQWALAIYDQKTGENILYMRVDSRFKLVEAATIASQNKVRAAIDFLSATYPNINGIADTLRIPPKEESKSKMSTRVSLVEPSAGEINVFRDTVLPQSKLAFNLGDSVDETAKALDQYVRQLISVYPPETQDLIRSIYFDRQHIEVRPETASILVKSLANWSIRTLPNGDLSFSVDIEPSIMQTKIWLRLTLIHEAVVHIGQAHSRLLEVGRKQFLADWEQNGFPIFTEMSAAWVEKPLIDAIPLEQIKADVAAARHSLDGLQTTLFSHGVSISTVSDLHIVEYVLRRGFDSACYSLLAHRQEQPTTTQISLFERRTFPNR